MTAESMRVLLAGCLIAMYILAMLCLLAPVPQAQVRRRPLSLSQFIAWGIFALFVPALGPFLVILIRTAGLPRNRLTRPTVRR